MRAIIVDDEPLAQQRLSRLLKQYDHIQLLACAADGASAVELVQEHKPDVVFLDIAMPKQSGLEAATKIADLIPATHIVFVTAHPEHALEAFSVLPAAYLLKPVETPTLDKVIQKLTQTIPVQQQPQQLSYKVGNQIKVQAVCDIIYVTKDGKYSQAVCKNKTLLLDQSLTELSEEYANTFTRIHRNTIVNNTYVQALQSKDGQHFVHLDGLDAPLPVSRRAVAHLKAQIG